MTPKSTRHTALWATTALALALPMAVTAQTKAPTEAEKQALLLKPITVYGERQGTAVHDVPASVSVVGGAEVEARSISDMHELVRYLAAVTVQRQTTGTDPFNSFGGFTIRGVGGNRVQMLVDGSRVPEGIQDGNRDYLDFNFTKQVDVVKGPASVLWGADALGGVVAVTTLDPEDILEGRDSGGTARLSYDGLNSETGVSAAFAKRFGPDLAVMMGISRTMGHEAKLSKARDDGGLYGCPRFVSYGASTCGELDPTDAAADRLLAKAVWTPSDEHRLEVSLDMVNRLTDVQLNYGLGPVLSSVTGNPTGEILHAFDRHLDMKRRRFAVEHTWTPDLAWVDEVKTTLAYAPGGYERWGNRYSTLANGNRQVRRDHLDFSENFLELDVQATSRFTTGAAEHEVTWGFDGDLTRTDYTSTDHTTNLNTNVTVDRTGVGFNFANGTTRRADLYVQDKISLMDGDLELTPGMRFATFKIDPRPDANYVAPVGQEPRVREDERVLKSLGALYRFDSGWQLWGHYGEGFKMPTSQQLFQSNGTSLVPAPNLEPEEVESIEVGVRREMERGNFGINAFKADYTNFIQSFYNIPGTSQYTYRNLAEVRVWGVELDGAYALTDNLTLTGSAIWQMGTQRTSPTADRTPHTLPPLRGTVGLTWNVPDRGLSFDVIGNFAAGVERTSSATNFKPDGYGVIDVFARVDVAENAVLNVGVKNLFDKRYFEASAASYSSTAGTAVAQTNPLELQTAPGRVFSVSLDMKF